MKRTTQEERLEALLEQHGCPKSRASGQTAWRAFKTYGSEVFGQSGVGLLFQSGIYTFTGTPQFYFDPLCQFEVLDHEGEHDHFEQLHCELTCEPHEHLTTAKAEMWSFDFATAEDFFSAVESLPAFQLALKQTDYNVAVTHEEV